MYMQANAYGEPSEVAMEDEDDLEDTDFDNGSCGICSAIVIDRGLLDCCQHWFCFTCIDNWATITNRCPLCKNEFQYITCLPVYDTTGSIIPEEHSLSRGADDWCIQGENNTFSFPSYYIDEDAVICLGSDGCKIRSGLLTAEDDSSFDTSVACDSCDTWYHAVCVGFNPECAIEKSWLCPRCISVEGQEKQGGVLQQNLGAHSAGKGADHGCAIDMSFSGKVSVSVADDGETALVVSMISGEQKNEASSISPLESKLAVNAGNEIETSCYSYSDNPELDTQLNKIGCLNLIGTSLIGSYVKGSDATALEEDSAAKFFNESVEMDFIQSDAAPEESLALSPIRETAVRTITSEPESHLLQALVELPEDVLISSYSARHGVLSAEKKEGKEENEFSDINPPLEISMASPSSGNEMVSIMDADMVDFEKKKNSRVKDSTTEVSENMQSQAIGVESVDIHIGEGDSYMRMKVENPAKKARLEGKAQKLPLGSQDTGYALNCHTSPVAAAVCKDNKLEDVTEEESVAPDIMSIVQENNNRSPHGEVWEQPESKKKGDKCGLRVKKIMRRAGEKEESSILVQKLRKEIAEVVQDKIPGISGKDDPFDGKLLTAFRAAIGKPGDALATKLDPSFIKTRKSLLQKGKIRENLTKKIYGTATGKRRRAWDRDWEVEFWKYRCSSIKPEKIETLQSVLELLKKSSNSCLESSEMVHQTKGGTTDSILSRVYLADASVFPRKDDIKPLSALAGIEKTNQNITSRSYSLSEKTTKALHEHDVAEILKPVARGTSHVKVPSGNTGKELSSSNITREAPVRRGNGASVSGSNIPAEGKNSQKQDSQTDGNKRDKRKWALEILARKNASSSSNATKDKPEDGAMLKGNYPLLAQLPTDMRPVLATSHHKKVPLSVRQAQLYRLTEHYLRKTNLAVIRRTADTELAVVDAVNIEREILERSNSKLVYLNLCSQILCQYPKPETGVAASYPTVNTESCTDQVPEETSLEPAETGWSNAEEALRMAGLSSDSPPNSPARKDKNIEVDPLVEDKEPAETGWSNAEEALRVAGLSSDTPPNSPVRKDNNIEVDTLVKDKDEGLKHISDMVPNPDLDTRGDNDYDLENEGCIASSCKNVDSQTMVILSTLEAEDPLKLMDSDALRPRSPDEKAAFDHSGDSIVEVTTDSEKIDNTVNTPSTLEPSQGNVLSNPSLMGGKELCESEKEPLDNRVSGETRRHLSKSVEMEAEGNNLGPCEAGNNRAKDGATGEFEYDSCAENSLTSDRLPLNHKSSGGENSPTHSLMNENAPKEERSTSISNKMANSTNYISKKVEAYIKEHIRPLCKSGVITVEQYRWAVAKATDKVMKFHYKAKNANFLIKEGDKVKKLAEQYVEAAQQRETL
ncbi:uncharacterized protein At4g10930 isoform X1 [Typha angustifolia]|uniref:uncharacterized protein At4g10930 isoform X1 n=1 Tax=Typha angustifolia TaxID=59011 RepID=UPI003C2F70AD